MKRKIITAIAGVVAIVGLATACEDENTNARTTEEDTAERQLDGFLKAQPIPVFNWSQLRQNLIEILTAQADTTATTSFMFNQGVVDPVHSCPSIGFAIPASYQLTNPDNVVLPGTTGERGSVTIAQLESTGVYTGDSTGTYAICVDAKGKAYAFYWEGFVSVVTGPATWNATTKSIELTGAPTGTFTVGE